MSMDKINEYYFKWTLKTNKKDVSIMLGVLIESMLKLNRLGKFSFYFIYFYLFLYEMRKVLEIIRLIVFVNGNFYKFLTVLQSYFDYISLEKYISNSVDSGNYVYLVLTLTIQLLIVFYFIVYFYTINFFEETDKYSSRVIIALFNMINVILQILPFSLNYINLMTYYFSRKNEITINIYLYLFNILVTISFSFTYILYALLLNDCNPQKNTYFSSVSRPVFNLLTFFKFVIYDVIILVLNFLPSFYIVIYVLGYYLFYLYYFIRRVYIINKEYYKILIFKIPFFSSLILSYYVISFIYYNSVILVFLAFLISTFLTIAIAIKLDEFRIKSFYEINKYNDDKQVSYINDELYLYNLLCKKKINFKDLFKHINLCKYNILDNKCVCTSLWDNLESTEQIYEEIKSNTCWILLKLNKKTDIYVLFHLNYLLSKNKINPSLFSFLIRFDSSQLPIYNFHFFNRINQNLKNIFKSYYTIQNSPKMSILNQVNLESLKIIISYEFMFKIFLKNIKKSLNLCINFWLIVKQRPICKKMFFKFGLEMAGFIIEISKNFGEMQEICQDQIKLLKVYSCFINIVLNDIDYSQILTNLIKEKLQTMENLSKNINSNFLEKELGMIIISTESNIFKIVAYNKFAKMSLKIDSKFKLKNTNIHYLQPFPFNLFHNHYIRNKFDLTLISKERVLNCIDKDGDLIYLNTNITPCINFNGKINFFMSFYKNNSVSLSSSALVDLNGRIYAATKDFKSEFKLQINFSFYKNIELYEKAKNLLNDVSDLKEFNNIDNILHHFNDENYCSFPSIFDYIEESRVLIKSRICFTNKNDQDTLSQLKDNNNDTFLIDPLDVSQRRLSIFQRKSLLINYNQSIKDEVQKQHYKTQNINYFNSQHLDIKSAKIHTSAINFTTKLSLDNENKNNYEDFLLSSFKFTELITRNTKEYKLNIEKNTALSGLFSYYSVSIISNSLSNNMFIQNEENHTLVVNTTVDGMHNLTSINGNSTINNEFKNAIKISTLMTKFQKNTININTYSKVFKSIYLKFIIIFLAILSLRIYMISLNIYQLNNCTDNFNILDNFSKIKFNFLNILLNSQTLLNIRSNFSSNDYLEFNDKSSYLTKSIYNDINNLESNLLTLINTDLSEYPGISNLTYNPLFNLSSLGNHYTMTYNNYNYANAFTTILLNIKNLLLNQNFTWRGVSSEKRDNPTENEKTVSFIFINYLQTFSPVLDEISMSVLKECTGTLQDYKGSFSTYIILEISLQILIMILIILNVLKLYQIENFLFTIFNELTVDYVILYIERINEISKKIYNINNDEIRNNSFIKMTLSKFKKNIIEKKKIILNAKENFQNEDSQSALHSSIKLLMDKPDKLIKIDKNDVLEIIQENSEKSSRKSGKFNTKYLCYFLCGLLSFLTFLYVIIIQQIFGLSMINILQDFFYDYNMIQSRMESEYLIIEIVQYSLVYNSSLLNLNLNLLFNNNIRNFVEKEMEFDRKNFNGTDFHNVISDKRENYYTDKFCSYFYNNSQDLFILYPNINVNTCLSSNVKSGIQIFLINLKNDLIEIRDISNNITNETLIYNLMSKDTFNLGSIVMGYYVKGFYNDLITSANSFFFTQIENYKNIFIVVNVIFTFHFSAFVIYVFFIKFNEIYFYFEKIRVIISIIATDFFKDRNKINVLIDKFY